jgi:uncharacterized membrane protein YphA (DoxX/SURF4 family)
MQVAVRPATTSLAVDTRVLAAGFFGLQFFVGYEWVMSGLSKALSGNFASSLAGTLGDMTKDQSGLYKSFIDSVAIPNGTLFGYLVMAGELSVGAVLLTTSLVALARWPVLGVKSRYAVLGLVASAALIGTFMSLNFHMAMGSTAPWAISPNPNDQGVDLDSLMMIMQLVLVSVSVGALWWLRRDARKS